jgi:hypothetical protein
MQWWSMKWVVTGEDSTKLHRSHFDISDNWLHVLKYLGNGSWSSWWRCRLGYSRMPNAWELSVIPQPTISKMWILLVDIFSLLIESDFVREDRARFLPRGLGLPLLMCGRRCFFFSCREEYRRVVCNSVSLSGSFSDRISATFIIVVPHESNSSIAFLLTRWEWTVARLPLSLTEVSFRWFDYYVWLEVEYYYVSYWVL